MRNTIKALSATAVSMALGAGAANAQTTLAISSWLPPSHAATKALVEWAGEVEKASNGRIKHNLLAKAVSSPPATFDAIRDGLADVSWTVDGYTPGRFVLTRVAEFPFMGETAEVNSVAYQRIHERYLAKANEHNGVRVLSVFSQGPTGIYTTKKAVKSPDDLQGLKFRIGGGMLAELSKQLGVNAVLRPASESYELLSSGIVDGHMSGLDGIQAFKLEKVLKYYTRFPGGMYNNSFTIFMHPGTYTKLSAADKKAVDSASGEKLARIMGKHWNVAEDAGRQTIRDNNIAVIDADKAFLDVLRQKSQAIEDAWYKDASQKGVDGRKALGELRDEIRKLSR